MQYSYIPTVPKAPAFYHEFDSRIMPGRKWEPGVTISVPRNKKPSTGEKSKGEVPGRRSPVN
jgi:hypothetical protein